MLAFFRVRARRSSPLTSAVRSLMAICACAAPLSSAAQAPAVGGSIIRGRVIDDQSGAPVANAIVNVSRGVDTLGRVTTDDGGYFRTSAIVDGGLILSFRRLGYQSGRIAIDSLARRRPVAIAMTALPGQLDAVTVSANAPARQARLAGFDERAQRRMGGIYLTRVDLDKAYTSRVSDVLRRLAGARVVESGGVLLVASARGYKVDLQRGDGIAPCVMRVGVDGQIREPGFPIDAIDPSHIHGIEVYNGPATIPPEFSGLRSDSYCGLVMIWTRVE